MRGFCATAKRRETSSSFRRRSGRRLRVIISRNAHHATTTSTRTLHVRLATVRATRTRASAFEARGASARPRRFEGTPGSGIRAERRSARSVRPTQPPTTRSSARCATWRRCCAAARRRRRPTRHSLRKGRGCRAGPERVSSRDSRLARRLRRRRRKLKRRFQDAHRAEVRARGGARAPAAAAPRATSVRVRLGKDGRLRTPSTPRSAPRTSLRRRLGVAGLGKPAARRTARARAAVAMADARRGGAEAR